MYSLLQEVVSCYIAIYIGCTPIFLAVALRQYGVISFPTIVNLCIPRLQLNLMAQTFIVSRKMWTIGGISKKDNKKDNNNNKYTKTVTPLLEGK
jgi:hypothetical protein